MCIHTPLHMYIEILPNIPNRIKETTQRDSWKSDVTDPKRRPTTAQILRYSEGRTSTCLFIVRMVHLMPIPSMVEYGPAMLNDCSRSSCVLPAGVQDVLPRAGRVIAGVAEGDLRSGRPAPGPFGATTTNSSRQLSSADGPKWKPLTWPGIPNRL